MADFDERRRAWNAPKPWKRTREGRHDYEGERRTQGLAGHALTAPSVRPIARTTDRKVTGVIWVTPRQLIHLYLR